MFYEVGDVEHDIDNLLKDRDDVDKGVQDAEENENNVTERSVVENFDITDSVDSVLK